MAHMSDTTEKTTIYLDPKVKKSVQYYALRDDSSLSQIINTQLEAYIEDMADIAVVAERMKNPEFVSWKEVKRQLKADGLL